MIFPPPTGKNLAFRFAFSSVDEKRDARRPISTYDISINGLRSGRALVFFETKIDVILRMVRQTESVQHSFGACVDEFQRISLRELT